MENKSIEYPAGHYLLISVAGKTYGIDLTRVMEIVTPRAFKPAAAIEPYITGMVERQGWIIPVMDLRRRFGVVAVTDTRLTCIVVLSVLGDDGPVRKGMTVDAVTAALAIRLHDIEPVFPPVSCRETNQDSVIGRTKIGVHPVTLLDIDLLFRHAEVCRLFRAA